MMLIKAVEVFKTYNEERNFKEFNTDRGYLKQKRKKAMINLLDKFEQIDGGISATKRKKGDE